MSSDIGKGPFGIPSALGFVEERAFDSARRERSYHDTTSTLHTWVGVSGYCDLSKDKVPGAR